MSGAGLYGWLAIAGGGALGAVARYGGVMAVNRLMGAPLGTMAVNVAGSFAMGLALAFFMPKAHGDAPWPLPAQYFLTIGFLGGFTTFSAFSADVMNMLLRTEIARAFCYVSATLVFCLGFIFAGFWLGRRLFGAG